ncbi:MAG TPA: hypothetical protein OIM33_01675 [Ruminococcus bromii]|nr:hypothetical protein [Ruminococcus bromii]HJI85911.1 hypothetical protein [Ruminococcus bromii]
MIIYDKRKPKTFDGANCVGITGENLAETQEFLIRGMCDITVDYTIHLRFADGSVNSVIPDSTAIDETGTKLVWKVRKNDIFMHGYFELQLEGRGENGYVFQTQIVTLYADESIPIEDKEYLNPNSETLKLREETQKLLDETKLCRTEIDKTKKLIEQSDITKKEDNSNKVSDSSQITDYTQNYPSIKYLTDNYWDSADSYSSDEVDILLNAKADNKSLNERLVRMDMSIGSKYDSANIESGTSKLTPYSTVTNKIKSASCMYKTIGDVVIVSATVKMNAVSLAGNSMCPLIDLPYKCISEDNVFCVGISNLGKLFKFAIPKNNTWLQFSTQDKTTYTFADGEQINAICLYKIK